MVNAASGGERDKLVEGGTERVGSRAGAVRVLAQVAAEAAGAGAAAEQTEHVPGDVVERSARGELAPAPNLRPQPEG